MPKPLIDRKLYEAAATLAEELEEAVALTVGRFDKDRWPQLSFPTFPIERATAAVSPDCSYRFLRKAIDAAESTLLLYIYDISAPYLLDLLLEAKQRGVKIRSMYDANSQGNAEKERLKAVGQTKAAPSSGDRQVFTVCHQKFMVIDKQIVVVESANWAKSSVPQIKRVGEFQKANREWFIRFDDTTVAAWFVDLFEADWGIPTSGGVAEIMGAGPGALLDVAIPAAVRRPGRVFDVQEVGDPEAKIVPVVSPDNYLREVKSLLTRAKTSIYLQQQYVLAGDGVRELLQCLAKKRVAYPAFDIRIISSAAFPENWKVTKLTLQAAGLLDTLKAINPASFGHCHNKGVIVDGNSVVVSSTNWSANSLLRAREAGVLIHSERIARYYQEVFLVDWREGLRVKDTEAHLTILEGADAI